MGLKYGPITNQLELIMDKFTGFEYLLIDVANQYGLDKYDFPVRIQWATENLDKLEALGEAKEASGKKWKERPLYWKAVMAIRKAQQGIPTGHLVGFDGVCSGMQIMSVLTGCKAGATATGLVENHRADAYSSITRTMNEVLSVLETKVEVDRDVAKPAVMTSLYGSKAQPRKLFGKGTPELEAFYEAMQITCPGAWGLLHDLLESWQPYALKHEWQLPDGFEAKVKVMQPVEARIEVAELDNSSFTYQFYVNEGQKKGLSNAANVVHSVDAYVLRCIHRRCNYDADTVWHAGGVIYTEQLDRLNGHQAKPEMADAAVQYYIALYTRTKMADAVILPHLNEDTVQALSDDHLKKLANIVETMVQHKPFEVVTIHDEFKCHANNMNHLRWHYINILAEMAEADLLSYIFDSIYGATGGHYDKLSDDLSKLVMNSNYALC